MTEKIEIETPVLTEEMQTGLEAMVKWSGSLVVGNDQERATAIEGLKRVKVRGNAIKAWFKPSKDAAAKAHKAIVAQEKSVTNVLDEIERQAKVAVVGYDTEQESLRNAERARLQAIADAKARKEAARLQAEAAKLKTPELKEERLQQAEEVVAPVVQVAAPEAVKGASTRKTWKARVVDAALVPREYMTVNEKALNAVAKATKGSIKIEGVEFYSESLLAVRA